MTEEPKARSLPPEYFESLYQRDPDPWGFATRPYEAAKYSATLAALPRPTYRNALEVGCSIGVLTDRLAVRCEALLALDVSDTALGKARDRCRAHRQVRFERMQVPDEMPEGPFDLILLSEVGYYWSPDDRSRAIAGLAGLLEPGGHLLLVHWTPTVADYPQTGDAVHEAFLAGAQDVGLVSLGGSREESYRIDLFEKRRETRIGDVGPA